MNDRLEKRSNDERRGETGRDEDFDKVEAKTIFATMRDDFERFERGTTADSTTRDAY